MEPIAERPGALMADVASVSSKNPMYCREPVMLVIVVGREMVFRVLSFGAGTIWMSP